MTKNLFHKTGLSAFYLFVLLLDFTTLAQSTNPPQPGNNNGGGDLELDDVPLVSPSKIMFLMLFGLVLAFYHFRKPKIKQSKEV